MEAAYRDGGPSLDAALDYIGTNLSLLRECLGELPEVALIEPEGTFLVWLDFRALDMSPEELTTFLRGQVGWAVTRGPAFGEQGIGFARLNIACTRARLVAALAGLKSAIMSRR